ncbi:MAG: HAD-IC family P-type ATPase, partial [Methyloprofundus sp.]|nr:HAD-IC family P-type ATPase [Methyloprofundus sp.]
EKRIVYLKGSVESILQRCNSLLEKNGDLQSLNHAEIHRQVEIIARQGLRVLAFARLSVSIDTQHINHNTVASGLEFIGLQGMIDPPREEATRAIAACQTAGIEVKMITGDHPATAAAIASQLGLSDKATSALNGRDLEGLFDAELIQAASTTSVFARVTPEQKLRLVEALQASGEVVAMTGDGVNDAPALRKADIGVAMGMTGTEVAKEAADMVLTNDNFSTIEAAVERRIEKTRVGQGEKQL